MRKTTGLFMTQFKNYGLQLIPQMGLGKKNESSFETNTTELSIHYKLIFAQMDRKFLHFHEYKGLSQHLKNPCIRSFPKTIQCN